MRIIQIKKNQKEIWNRFIAGNNSESFLQSWEWGSFQSKIGRKIWRIGIVEDDLPGKKETSKLQITNKFKIQSASWRTKFNPPAGGQNSKLIVVALIVKHDLPFGRSYLYCPRGPVISRKFIKSKVYKVEDLNFLFDEIKKIAKKEKSLFLRIDPAMEWNPESRIWNLENSGFKKTSNEIQPKDTLILDLTKSEEELLKEMKQKTRYNIRLAGKKELRIRNYELGMDNKKIFEEKFEEFWELIKETSERDKFSSHNKDYYWKMLESLGEIQNFAGAGLPACPAGRQPVPNISHASEKERETSKQKKLVCNQFPLLQAKLYLAEYENKTIAANIVLYFGDLAIYLHGASSGEYRNTMAPYLLQWRQVMDAKNIGCEKYDFWGIDSSQKSIKLKVHKVNNGWGGITRFKKGFGGYEKNYIGAYDLIFSNIGYAIYESVKFIKSKVR